MKRKVKSILSIRNQQIQGTRSWDIVFEWEDILSENLGLPIKPVRFSYITAILKKLRLYKYLNQLFKSKNLCIQFVTDLQLKSGNYQSCNIIPIVIDFWYDKDEEINKFIELCKNVPLMIVTNREVYNLLLKKDCNFPIAHLALSLPDQYMLNEKKIVKEKKFEFGFIGRINPFFMKMIQEYAANHENFEYVYSKGISVEREYWTNKGRYIGKDNGRESYVSYLKQTKITCYSTPGADESKKVSYNQVTPRVLEMLSNGCMVIGHYPISDDVKWYGLENVVPRVENYSEFEQCLDKMRNETFDFVKVSHFLDSNYTSRRAVNLKSILSDNKLF